MVLGRGRLLGSSRLGARQRALHKRKEQRGEPTRTVEDLAEQVPQVWPGHAAGAVLHIALNHVAAGGQVARVKAKDKRRCAEGRVGGSGLGNGQ